MSRARILATYSEETGRNRPTEAEVLSVVDSYEKILKDATWVQLTTWHAWHSENAASRETPFQEAMHQHFLSIIEKALEVRP